MIDVERGEEFFEEKDSMYQSKRCEQCLCLLPIVFVIGLTILISIGLWKIMG
jgi:hypothetical protein